MHHEVEKEAREKGTVKVIISSTKQTAYRISSSKPPCSPIKGYKHRVTTPMDFFAMA